MANMLDQPRGLNLTNPLPGVQTAAQNLGSIFASYPFLQAMMDAISNSIQERGSHIRVRSPLNKDLITYGSTGINSFFSSRSLFIQSHSRLHTQLDFSCSTRGNLFTKLSLYLGNSILWAASGSSDPISIDFKVFEVLTKPKKPSTRQKLLHVRCKTDGLPGLTCTSSLTEKMRRLYIGSNTSITPRQEEFRLISTAQQERLIDIIFVKTLISNVLEGLKK